MDAGAGWVESRGGRLLRAAPGGGLDRAERIGGAVLGVRPEHVLVSVGGGEGSEGGEGGEGGVPGRVAELAPQGREIVVTVELDGGLELRALVPASTALRTGDAVRVAIDAGSVHLFDASTGESRRDQRQVV